MNFFLLFCLTAIKDNVIKYVLQFTKEMVNIYFGILKIQVEFLINRSLEIF